ncbi:MAG TPA: acyl-CoA dehydrogenase family protein [Rhodoplanes sp.]|nr:acyl-CoA dehydrogenase family protein [Rhodoplanes sp.]
MTYRAPLDDILFNILAVAPGPVSPEIPAETREEWRTILEQAAVLVEETIAPLNRASDMSGSVFENGVVRTPRGWREAYATWAEAGWNGVSLPPSHGGAGLPVPIGTATMEMLTSACMALSTLPVLAQCAAPALAAHAEPALVDLFLPKLVSGEWTATMNLTEPQAGSDLGLLTSRAEPAGDGTYRLFGQKTFITFGEHDLAENIIHLVLARLPGAPPGTRGLSLFVVPKFLVHPDGRLGPRNDLRCAGVEHKLGIRASPTCTMIYGDAGGAIGWLVGEPHRGLHCMFTMMNGARLATGLQGVAIAERAYQQALAYAQERRQGRATGYTGAAPIIAHPDVRRMLGRMKALTAAGRALAYFTAAAIDDAHASTEEAARRRGEAHAGLLTPVFKGFATENGVEVASLGIQVHGGMGYIEETGAAQHWRDARIPPIYEGTNGIQAIDLVTRKVAPDGGAGMQALIEECRAMLKPVASLPAEERLALAPAADLAAGALNDLVAATKWLAAAQRDPDARLYAATPYLRLAAIALGASLLMKGAGAAARMAAAGGAWSPNKRTRMALAAVFADELAVEAPGLLRKIRTPVPTREMRAAALELEA